MKVFQKDNVILRTNDPLKEKELKLRGFEEVKPKETPKVTKKKETKASSE